MRFYWPIAKVDGEQRMVWGYASTEAQDEQGETVTRAGAGRRARRLHAVRQYPRDAPALGGRRRRGGCGRRAGASISAPDRRRRRLGQGGRGRLQGVFDRRPGHRPRPAPTAPIITGLKLTEISVVDRPANPEAVFDCWKRAAAMPASRTTIRTTPADYADPGYQPDAQAALPDRQRAPYPRRLGLYPPAATTRARYTTEELARIKARIVAAWQAEIDPAGPPAAAQPPRRAQRACRSPSGCKPSSPRCAMS